jgi:hypothetical protein
MKMLTATVPADDELGPAMLALPDQRRKFVIAYLETLDATKAAYSAGWGGTHGSAKVQGHRMMHDHRVLKAIREEAERKLDGGVYIAAAGLVKIAASDGHRDQYKACADIMDRRGFLRITGQHIEIEDKRTDGELMAFIKAMAIKHKLDPRLLLGSDVLEGEAKDVTPKRKVRGKQDVVAQADAVARDEDERQGD